MKYLKENKATSIVVDFNELKNDSLNESMRHIMFGGYVTQIMAAMFGEASPFNLKVRGNQNQVDSFTKSLAGQKRYMDSYIKYGLNDPRTVSNKSLLQAAVAKFERATGLKWPFK